MASEHRRRRGDRMVVARLAAILLAGTAAAGCRSANPWVEGAAGGPDAVQIQLAALDFITDHYVRDLQSRAPAVYCVGLRPAGRIQAGPDPLELSRRDDRWDPAGMVLRALQRDQDREIRPLSECSWDSQAREIHRRSGAAAISFVAGPVRFETPNLAMITVEAREAGHAGGRFGCRLERGISGWTVDTCV